MSPVSQMETGTIEMYFALNVKYLFCCENLNELNEIKFYEVAKMVKETKKNKQIKWNCNCRKSDMLILKMLNSKNFD